MSSYNELKEYSDDELLSEIDRRRKARTAVPPVISEPDFTDVISFYVKTLEQALVKDHLDIEGFQEGLDFAVGKAIFGSTFREWRRTQTF